jgi:hypothetical protein
MGVCLVAGVFVLLALALAPLDVFSYSLEGRTVSGPTFLRAGGLRLAVDGVLLLAAGIGILRRRRWARPVLAVALLYRVSQSVLTLTPLLFAITLAMALLPVLLILWYVYRAPGAKRYFAGG